MPRFSWRVAMRRNRSSRSISHQPLDAVAFDAVAFPVGLAVEGRVARLVALGRDHRPDAATPDPPPRGGAAVALVARHPPPAAAASAVARGPGGGSRPGRAAPPARPARAARRKSAPPRSARRRPRRAGGPRSRTRPGSGLAPRLHPPTAPVRRAPAACWCARTMVASTRCGSRSTPPLASASAWSAAEGADLELGMLLARAPEDEEGVWPVRQARGLLESIWTDDLARGLRTGLRNKRGRTRRAIEEGGDQERALAAKYRGWGDRLVAGGWFRLASVLHEVAADYDREAGRKDQEAERRRRRP
jgi:hypothetical protein